MTVEDAVTPGARVRIGTWPTPERAVIVRVPVDVAYDLARIQAAQEVVLDRLGCPRCHSGYDIRFESVERVLSLDAPEARS